MEKEIEIVPKVSIITPSYNSEEFIKQTIKSVVKQTFQKWELIVIDDCSQDNTREIVKAYEEIDNRIKLLELEKNSGAAVARNKGIEIARGTYIAFLDSDDIWEYTKLEKQIKFMEEKDIAFSFCGYEVIDEHGNSLGKEVKAPNEIRYNELLGNTIIGCLTVMLNKEKIGEFRMPNVKPEDTALWLEILRTGFKAYGIQESLAKYRIVQGSVSRNKLKAAGNYLKVLWRQKDLNIVRKFLYFILYAFNALKKNK
ncbi:glycosyltransferase family 2 protein [Bacillus cereus group sp. BfR-BA-01428]|uniref:glycosyltransferase family 2 protein n=1 Tax=Bacillus cereus group sp. BfR-BA-01428 TaxID=2920345 RepID=UPI001F57B177|nr:glycosyltransferase [Bacillus cereus]